MSFAGITWAWDQPLGSANARLVLVYLACRTGDDGQCWPSQETIATKCNMSPRAVYDALKYLEAEGKITRTRRMVKGVRTSDLISIQFTRHVIFEHGPDIPRNPSESATRDDDEVTESATTVEKADTESANRASELPASPAGSPESHSHVAPKLPAGGARESPVESPEERKTPGTVEQPPAREVDLSVLAARIFAAGTDVHRRKCGDDPGKIVYALRDAVARGEDPMRITSAMEALLTSGDQTKQGGKYASSPARLIDDNRWVHWVGRAANMPSRDLDVQPAPVTEVTHEGVTYAVPPGGQSHKIGTYESPGIQRQMHILTLWNRKLSDWDSKKWGPPPGAEGCRLWPSVLERFKHESVGPTGIAANIGSGTVPGSEGARRAG